MIGYPIPVCSSGEIRMPELESIKVSDMQLTDAQKLIRTRYSGIRKNSNDLNISVQMLSNAGDVLELRSLSSPSTAAQGP